MEKGELSSNTFSYKEPHRFNDKNYILVVRDKEISVNVIPILHLQEGRIQDIDDYEMGDKICTTPNRYMQDVPSISSRFSVNQLIKISFGSIIENQGHFENEFKPRSKTFHTNLNELKDNEIIEIFEGEILEENAIFIIKEKELEILIKDIYIQSNNVFFILENEILKGPFRANKIDKSGNFIIEKSQWRKFGIYSFNTDSYIEFNANEIKRRIIIPGVVDSKFIKEIDFISDIEIINRFKSQIESNPADFNPDTLKNLLEILQKSLSLMSVGENDRNQERLFSILKSTENEILAKINISQIVPEIAQIRVEIDDLEKKRFSLKNEQTQVEKRIEELNGNKERLDEDIKNLSVIREEELKNKKSDLETEINDLELRKSKLDEEIQKDKDAKSSEIKELEGTNRYLENLQLSLKDGIKTLQEEFTSEQKTAHQKLKELLTQNQHYNILSGREYSGLDDSKKLNFTDFQISIMNYSENENKLNNYGEFKSKLTAILEKNNRKFETHFIDNVLISIHQNTLTLFAGLPGTGKTSLVRLLTSILAPKERVREISVGKGWTSQKDLIGFFNPLSKSFHASPTNLYSLLKQLDYERENNQFLRSPLSYVLLDEANLSPMEHYWSVFYNLTDSSSKLGSFLKINLGDTEKIEYANNLRFIGTINYDQTTEELSPRVIDRANIIRMQPKAFEINNISCNEIDNLKISYSECIDLFDLIDFSKDDKIIGFDPETEIRFNTIKKKFEELKIFISPRVQISIKRYCSVAKIFMYEENKPLDYCIAQRLLPLIRVQGKKAKIKLNELLDILKSSKYDISSKILEDIIQTGSEGEIFQDNFNYFLTLSHV